MTKKERIAVLEAKVLHLSAEIERLKQREERVLPFQHFAPIPIIGPGTDPYKEFYVTQPFTVTCDGRMPK